VPLKKHLLSIIKKTRQLLCLLEAACGYARKWQRGFIGKLTSTLLGLPEPCLAGRCLLSGCCVHGAQVPLQHDCSLPTQIHAAEGTPATMPLPAGFSRVLEIL